MSTVKVPVRKAVPFLFLASAVVGVLIHVGLVLTSGVDLMFTSKTGFWFAAWNVSPMLSALSGALLVSGVIGFRVSKS